MKKALFALVLLSIFAVSLLIVQYLTLREYKDHVHNQTNQLNERIQASLELAKEQLNFYNQTGAKPQDKLILINELSASFAAAKNSAELLSTTWEFKKKHMRYSSSFISDLFQYYGNYLQAKKDSLEDLPKDEMAQLLDDLDIMARFFEDSKPNLSFTDIETKWSSMLENLKSNTVIVSYRNAYPLK